MSMVKCESCGTWVPTCVKLIDGCEWCYHKLGDGDTPHINESREPKE